MNKETVAFFEMHKEILADLNNQSNQFTIEKAYTLLFDLGICEDGVVFDRPDVINMALKLKKKRVNMKYDWGNKMDILYRQLVKTGNNISASAKGCFPNGKGQSVTNSLSKWLLKQTPTNYDIGYAASVFMVQYERILKEKRTEVIIHREGGGMEVTSKPFNNHMYVKMLEAAVGPSSVQEFKKLAGEKA